MASYNFYRQLGVTSISNGLIAYYARLGLTEAELALVLQLEAFFHKKIKDANCKNILLEQIFLAFCQSPSKI